MVPQERDLITTLLTRLKAAAGQPKDAEADTLIRQALAEQPDAQYYLVQTVLIQDLSLHNAQNRIAELERQVADAQAAPQPSGTSFLGGLFGRNQPAPPVPASVPNAGPWSRSPQVAGAPPPGYAPQQPYPQQSYAPTAAGGLFGGGGGGFLRSAAATAAGVAGGALLFEGISSLFGHNYANGLSGGMGGMGMPGGLGETVINNYGDAGGGNTAGYGGGDVGGGTGGTGGGGGDFGGGGTGGTGGGGGDFGGGGTGGTGGTGGVSC